MARFNWRTVTRPNWQALKRPAMLTLGYTFLVLGVLGLFLPILQGFLFLAIGLTILARYAAWARLLRMRLVRRYPKLGAKLNNAERAWRYYLRRFKEKWLGFTGELRVSWRLWRWRLKETWCNTQDRLRERIEAAWPGRRRHTDGPPAAIGRPSIPEGGRRLGEPGRGAGV